MNSLPNVTAKSIRELKEKIDASTWDKRKPLSPLDFELLLREVGSEVSASSFFYFLRKDIVNKDTFISYEDVCNFFKMVNEIGDEPKAFAHLVFNVVDIDRSGKINFDEFVKYRAAFTTSNESDPSFRRSCQALFEKFDFDMDGGINFDEAYSLISQFIE